MLKVYVVQGEHPFVPGRPMFVCATKEQADLEASALVAIMARDHDIAPPVVPSDWMKSLRAVQDAILADGGELDPDEIDKLDDDVWRYEATGCDVWIEKKNLLG